MSSAQMKPAAAPEPVDSRVDAILADFAGDSRAVIAALLHNRDELLRDADRASSLGFLRGRFSEGARPVRDGEP